MGKIDQQKFVVSYEPLLFMYLLPRCKCRPDGPIVGPRWVLPIETSGPALCATWSGLMSQIIILVCRHCCVLGFTASSHSFQPQIRSALSPSLMRGGRQHLVISMKQAFDSKRGRKGVFRLDGLHCELIHLNSGHQWMQWWTLSLHRQVFWSVYRTTCQNKSNTSVISIS